MANNTQKKAGYEVIEDVTGLERWLNETRLYGSSGESFIRSVVWFLTWLIGIYFYRTTEQPISAIPNYLLLTASLAEDIYFNKLKHSVQISYRGKSNTTNVILFIVAMVVVVMACFQLSDYYSKSQINSQCYYNVMYNLTKILLIKVFLDFGLLLFFPKSKQLSYVINDEHSGEEDLETDSDELNEEFRKDMQDSAKSGPLTD